MPQEGLVIVGADEGGTLKKEPKKKAPKETAVPKAPPARTAKAAAAEAKAASPRNRAAEAKAASPRNRAEQAEAANPRNRVLQAGKLCLDWHQVLQIGRESRIRPMWVESVLALKKAGWQIAIISYVSPGNNDARSEEIWRELQRTDLRSSVEGVWTCPERGGPKGKVHQAMELGCTAVMDDNPTILQEALDKGLMVFAITTPWEHHKALKKTGVSVFRDLPTASEAILCRMIDVSDL